jgi:hypothetical protein
MGKKAKTIRGKARAEGRKLDLSELPPPPDPPGLEVCKQCHGFLSRVHHITSRVDIVPVPADLYYYGCDARSLTYTFHAHLITQYR